MGGVFVLTDSENLVPMSAAAFATEDDFQRLLAKFPALLSGDEAFGESARRWLLIKREKSVPSEDGGAARWSIDHLFVDQEGVPTIVEVKRQTDTRLRREVIGQMLDYAANGVAYWPIEQLELDFHETCRQAGVAPADRIRDFLGTDAASVELWQKVKTNLQAGRIRLLFVADRIPPELRRVVEFLNRQMDPAEVLALELRQFEGAGLKTIVPVLYGRTEEAQSRKAASSPTRQWNEVSFFEALSERNSKEACVAAREILDRMRSQVDEIIFGRGAKDGSATIMISRGIDKYYPLSLWTYGRMEIDFQYIIKGPFESDEKRRELLNKLNEIEGINLPEDSIGRRPSLPISLFADPKKVAALLEIISWVIGELRSPF